MPTCSNWRSINGALSGLSRDGEHYFYANPLESNGSAERWDWHTCPCCTMNVSRLVASVGGYFVSTAPDGVAFHLYGGISASREIAGTTVALRETSNYPWSGDIKINIDPETPAAFDVKLRVPGWCQGATIAVNGEAVERQAGQRLRHHPPHLEPRATPSPSTCRCRRSGFMPTRASSWMPAASR